MLLQAILEKTHSNSLIYRLRNSVNSKVSKTQQNDSVVLGFYNHPPALIALTVSNDNINYTFSIRTDGIALWDENIQKELWYILRN